MVELDISHNNVRLEELDEFPKLENLNLQGNNLKYIEDIK